MANGRDTSLGVELFGTFILHLRAAKGLTAAEFARRAGLSLNTVRAIEEGRSEYELEELVAIGRGLGMKLSAIFRIWEQCHSADPGPMIH